MARIGIPVPCRNASCPVAEMLFKLPKRSERYTFDCPICGTPGTLTLHVGRQR